MSMSRTVPRRLINIVFPLSLIPTLLHIDKANILRRDQALPEGYKAPEGTSSLLLSI